MAWEIPGVVISRPAGADLSALQYTFVKLDASGDTVLAATQGEAVVGVLQNNPDASGTASIMTSGVSKIRLEGTEATGDQLTPATVTGRGETAASGDFVAGYCVLGGAAGELGSVSLTGGGQLN